MSKTKVKVLHVVYAMNAGGIESWLMSILRSLQGQECDFAFLVNVEDGVFYDKEIYELGGEIYYGGRLSNPFEMFAKAKRVIAKGFDVVHCHNVENALPVMLAARSLSVRTVYQSHNDFDRKLKVFSYPKSLYLRTSNYFSCMLADEKLAVSQTAGSSLFKGGCFEVLSLGIDFTRFHPECDVLTAKDLLERSKGVSVLCHVGRFDKQKNHNFLVDVFALVHKRKPETRLWLLGDGAEKERVFQKVKAMGLASVIEFLGVRPDIPEILRLYPSLFLFPSLFEGLGLAVVEAQAAGVPVVCSDVLPEEATINPLLVHRVGLSQSEAEWCDIILGRMDMKSVDGREAYQAALDSEFNLMKTNLRLKEIWKEKI